MYGLDDPNSPLDLGKLTGSIQAHEGLRLKPYADSVGKLTIGYGRNLSDVGISLQEATFLLQSDIDKAISAAQGESWWPHVSGNDPRARAMCELVFNLGVAGVRTFVQAVAALCNDDFETAANQFLNSKWASQVGQRASILSEMIRTGLDQL